MIDGLGSYQLPKEPRGLGQAPRQKKALGHRPSHSPGNSDSENRLSLIVLSAEPVAAPGSGLGHPVCAGFRVYKALPLKRPEERKEQSGTQCAQPPGPGLSTPTGGGGGCLQWEVSLDLRGPHP